jgi:hypothetical protein
LWKKTRHPTYRETCRWQDGRKTWQISWAAGFYALWSSSVFQTLLKHVIRNHCDFNNSWQTWLLATSVQLCEFIGKYLARNGQARPPRQRLIVDCLHCASIFEENLSNEMSDKICRPNIYPASCRFS